MELHILNSYLKYQKEHSQSFFKEIVKIPIYMLVIFALSIVLLILSVIFCFVDGLEWLFLPFSIIEFILAFIVYILQERWEINHSDRELTDYKTYCKELYRWLGDYSITSKADIELLLNRLTCKVKEHNKHKKQLGDKIDKWMQTLIIPLIIAVVTALISNKTNIEEVLAYIFYLLAVVAIIYGLIWIIRSIVGFLENQKRSKMEYFINDLRGVIDVIFLFNSDGKSTNC